MIISSLIPCEAAVLDGRGSHVLVGANMNVVEAVQLPTVVTRSVYVLVEDTDREIVPGTTAIMRMSVHSPDGTKSRVARGDIEFGASKFPALPGNLQFAVPVAFEADTTGEYKIECEMIFEGMAELSRTVSIFVVDPSAE